MSLTDRSPNWRSVSSPAVAARIASRRSVVSPPSADRRPCGRRAAGPGDFAMAGSIPTPPYIHTVWTVCIVRIMSTLTCHLVTRNPDAAAAWYRSVLGAAEASRITLPGGQVLTIELRFGDSTLSISDEFPEMGVVSPLTLGGTYGALHLAVEDADAVWQRAMAEGATEFEPLHDAFWGDRTGQFIHPFGHRWAVGQHLADVPHEEVVRLAAAAFGGGQA